MILRVRGKNHSWGFPFYGDPAHIIVWQGDGLEVVLVENTIPELVVDIGLARPWCFIQDILNLKNWK